MGSSGDYFLLDSMSGARISERISFFFSFHSGPEVGAAAMRSPRLEDVAGRAAPRRLRETPPGAKAEAEEAAAARRPAAKSGREKTMAEKVGGRCGSELGWIEDN